jgi:acetyl-CoA synthetase
MITNLVEYRQQYRESDLKPEEFWAKQAEKLSWQKKWDRVLEYDFYKPEVKWFIGAKLNITEI